MKARPFIVPVFIPNHGCAHRCLFCNQHTVTGVSGLTGKDRLRAEINRFLGFRRQHRGKAEIAFYGGNFLGLDPARILSLLALATDYVHAGKVDGIRFSTRPDTIDEKNLGLISPFPVTSVELGVQSMNDAILAASRRGHTAQDTRQAVALLKTAGCTIGLQLMVGLPGDNEAISLSSAAQAAALAPGFVRIYPTLVLSGTALASWFRDGRYVPWSMDRAVTVVKKIYRLFQSRNIPVIRMGLQATEELSASDHVLAGPYHPSFGQLVFSEIYFDAVTAAGVKPDSGALTLAVNPAGESALRGIRNENLSRIQTRYGAGAVRVLTDTGLDPKTIRVQDRIVNLFG